MPASNSDPNAGPAPDGRLARRRRRWRLLPPIHPGPSARSRIYPAAIALSTVLLGLSAPQAPRAAIIAAAGAGALFVLRSRGFALLVAAIMILSFVLQPTASMSVAGWALAILMLLAGTASARNVPKLLRLPNWSWALAMVIGGGAIAATVVGTPLLAGLATALGSICAAYLGAGLARHLAMSDARLLSRDEEGLVAVTRDLLLGRITDGMLHNLAQPLNVISMANGNIDYIVEHLDIGPEARMQLTERIERIATHTDSAADILALFRSLGRDTVEIEPGHAAEPRERITVGRVLERAVAATRFTARHHISVVLTGTALDRPVPGRQGTLEILAVAALLSAFGAFVDRAGNPLRGTVVLRAEIGSALIVINVACIDGNEAVIPCRVLDAATRWLVEQVAREAGGDFTCIPHGKQPTELVLRLARDDA